MMQPITAHDTELWEAWIEYDHSDSQYFATLYVIADMYSSDSAADPKFRRMMNSTPTHLRLELVGQQDTYGEYTELFYNEPLPNLNLVNTVSIYSNDKLVKRFKDIDVLV